MFFAQAWMTGIEMKVTSQGKGKNLPEEENGRGDELLCLWMSLLEHSFFYSYYCFGEGGLQVEFF